MGSNWLEKNIRKFYVSKSHFSAIQMRRQDRYIYEFGPYRLDPLERLLANNGAQVSLSPKAFEVLLFLVRNNGKALSKDELMKAVWGDTFVEEANLAQTISVL